MPSGFLDDTFDELGGVAQDFMRDTFRVWEVEEDPNTGDKYDSRERTIYDGKASVSADTMAFEQAASGDESLDADAVVTIPLVEDAVEDEMLGKQCKATFRGHARAGTVKETRRREVTVQVAVEWT